MNTISIKKLELHNFKGIRSLTIDFKKTTDISGANETGKTTIFDAFTWVLFGKDSTDKSQFDIKTLDKNNVAIPKIEHSVTVTLDVNGTEVILKRVYKEKWVKKRGSLEAEFSGHETLYYWNDVPLLANEYSAKINDLIDEGIFKLITNPLYFNSLPWKDRRDVLIRIAGDVSDNEVIGDNEQFLKLITGLKEKSIEEYKREISSKKKLLNDNLKLIPTRINEASRGMPAPADFVYLKSQVEELTKDVEKIDGAIANKSQAVELSQQEYHTNQKKAFDIRRKMTQLELNEQRILDDEELNLKSTLIKLENEHEIISDTELVNAKSSLSIEKSSKDKISTKMTELRKMWLEINEEQFIWKENESKCYACGREVDNLQQKKAEFEAKFIENKNRNLTNINTDGLNLKKELETSNSNIVKKTIILGSVQTKITAIKKRIDTEKKIVEKYKKPELIDYLKDHVEYQKLVKELKAMDAKLCEAPVVDTTELTAQKAPIQFQIDELKVLLNDEKTIELAKKRILELETQEKNLAQQISELEGNEFVIDNFIKAKVDMLEDRINALFKHAKFKLFEIQINGGLLPCCETLYKGVPFSSLNKAATINIGIDIIGTLCEFHEVSAPIFVDNSEAVNKLIPVNSQLIRLLVTLDKELKIA